MTSQGVAMLSRARWIGSWIAIPATVPVAVVSLYVERTGAAQISAWYLGYIGFVVASCLPLVPTMVVRARNKIDNTRAFLMSLSMSVPLMFPVFYLPLVDRSPMLYFGLTIGLTGVVYVTVAWISLRSVPLPRSAWLVAGATAAVGALVGFVAGAELGELLLVTLFYGFYGFGVTAAALSWIDYRP